MPRSPFLPGLLILVLIAAGQAPDIYAVPPRPVLPPRRQLPGLLPTMGDAEGGPCAWRRELPDHDPQVDGWIAYLPHAHPAWDLYLISVAHLRDLPGVPSARRHYKAAAYELAVYALDPAHTMTELGGDLHVLSPANMILQFHGRELSDALVADFCAGLVAAFVAGSLSPDSDFADGVACALQRFLALHGGGAISARPGAPVVAVMAVSPTTPRNVVNTMSVSADATVSITAGGPPLPLGASLVAASAHSAPEAAVALTEAREGDSVRATFNGPADAVAAACDGYLRQYPPATWGTRLAGEQPRVRGWHATVIMMRDAVASAPATS